MHGQLVCLHPHALKTSSLPPTAPNRSNNPYLVANSRDAWLACSAPGYFSDNCPDMVQNSHLDFPRSM